MKTEKISRLIVPYGALGLLLFLLAATGWRLLHNTEILPEAGMGKILDGTLQKEWDVWMTEHFFGRSGVVSAHNQIHYSLFGDASGNWICGKERYLFSRGQVENYLQMEGEVPEAQEYDDFARKVYRMQTSLERAGKEFVYILTPNKVEIYPEKLPWYAQMIARHETAESRGSHARLVDAFRKNGVHYYDTTQDILRMKEESEFDVFARTGHHWTFTACAREMNPLFEGMKPLTPGIDYPVVDVLGVTDEVCAYDLDILNAQKVWFGHNRDIAYQSPVLAYPKMSPSDVYWFGTSYGALFTIALYQAPEARAFDRLVFQQYFTGRYVFDGQGISAEEFTQEDTPEDIHVMENIQDGDLIIMEQQADSGIYPTHVKFVDYVLACLED